MRVATQNMSPIRILIALVIAGLILAAEVVACWHFGFSTKWIPIVLLAVVVMAGTVLIEVQAQRALCSYLRRACTCIQWHQRFPTAGKTEIREFLDLFIAAFGFRRRCCFLPDDKVMDVYHAVYPPGSAVDGMELETLFKLLRKRYGVDFTASWRENITLGEIYEQTHQGA